ncbi:hypothetical protein ACKF11_01855 [Methylobacillus sp. Pita2]|uniref:hypothetical protein n=1 Tax=Methylobacillus sp. Pita2 TaxID=3383245 RepID=UPI0038B430DB
MRIVWFTLLLSLSSGPLLAEESQQPLETAIPTAETEFVQNIHQFDKATIVAQFGEPASKQDYHRPGTDELMASVWQYHYINTDLEGSYYQTTELDFIGDNVVMVVFMNHDGKDDSKSSPNPFTPDL